MSEYNGTLNPYPTFQSFRTKFCSQNEVKETGDAGQVGVEITKELKELGFQLEFVRKINAQQGRPGCIFFGQLQLALSSGGTIEL